MTQQMITRRSLLHTSGLVGLPLLGLSTTSVVDVLAMAPDGEDPVQGHILREGTKHAHALARGRSHETLAGIASNLRLHAAHLRSTHSEEKIAKALRKRLSKRGREAVIDEVTNPETQQKHHDDLAALGLEDLHVPEQPASRADVDRALTALSTPGAVASTLEQLADAVDEMNARNAVAAAHAVQISRVDGEQIDGFCNTFNNVCHFLALFTPVICVLAGAGGQLELVPVCAILTVETATACFISWLCGG
jgi:hypothetical protein